MTGKERVSAFHFNLQGPHILSWARTDEQHTLSANDPSRRKCVKITVDFFLLIKYFTVFSRSQKVPICRSSSQLCLRGTVRLSCLAFKRKMSAKLVKLQKGHSTRMLMNVIKRLKHSGSYDLHEHQNQPSSKTLQNVQQAFSSPQPTARTWSNMVALIESCILSASCYLVCWNIWLHDRRRNQKKSRSRLVFPSAAKQTWLSSSSSSLSTLQLQYVTEFYPQVSATDFRLLLLLSAKISWKPVKEFTTTSAADSPSTPPTSQTVFILFL